MLTKLYYKFFKSKESYNNYKLNQVINTQKSNYEKDLKEDLKEIEDCLKNKKTINFLHSGHCGDLIYSLPIIKKISETHECNLFIGIDKKVKGNYLNHPANGVYIDKRMADLMLPLLKHQSFIKNVNIHSKETIDISLDIYRNFPIGMNSNSCKWYSYLTGVNADLSLPFLNSELHPSINRKIVILRTFRYRNHLINYKFLNEFSKDLIFIGLESEFLELKKEIPKLEHYNPKDFLEMCQIIKSSKFFLGNQSIAFAIAEGLKSPRLLECCPDYTVVQPVGGECYDFYYQLHFEKWFKYLVEKC